MGLSISLIEKYGSGIKRVLDAFATYGLPQPEFQLLKSGFRVKVFSASYTEVVEKVVEKVIESLNNSQQKILLMIKNEPFISANKISKQIEISHRKVQENIAKLRQKGIIKRIGPDKGGYWEIHKNS